MSRKKIQFKPKSDLKTIDQALDEWVNTPIEDNKAHQQEESINTEKKGDISHVNFFRFTFHMPTALHKKIKKYCVDNEISMKEKIVEILEKEFSSH